MPFLHLLFFYVTFFNVHLLSVLKNNIIIYYNIIWLVVWNMFYFSIYIYTYIYIYILGIMIPTDELIFFRGVGEPPSSYYDMSLLRTE